MLVPQILRGHPDHADGHSPGIHDERPLVDALAIGRIGFMQELADRIKNSLAIEDFLGLPLGPRQQAMDIRDPRVGEVRMIGGNDRPKGLP